MEEAARQLNIKSPSNIRGCINNRKTKKLCRLQMGIYKINER